MTNRCKPGDLAIVTSHGHNPTFSEAFVVSHMLGKVVQVVEVVSQCTHGVVSWALAQPVDVQTFFGRLRVFALDDDMLTPIRGDLLGDEGQTDTPKAVEPEQVAA